MILEGKNNHGLSDTC